MSRSALYRCGCVSNRDGEGLYVSLIPCRSCYPRVQTELSLLAAALAQSRAGLRDERGRAMEPEATPIPLTERIRKPP